MLVCLKCWQKKEECKCDTTDNFQYVEIDDGIYSAIKQLNLLGYKTNFCCEGHTDDRGIQTYIVFDWDKNKQMFDSLPEGWRYDGYSYRKIKYYKYNIIRSIIPNGRKIFKLTEKEKQEIIDKNIKNLIQWVKQLKERE